MHETAVLAHTGVRASTAILLGMALAGVSSGIQPSPRKVTVLEVRRRLENTSKCAYTV